VYVGFPLPLLCTSTQVYLSILFFTLVVFTRGCFCDYPPLRAALHFLFMYIYLFIFFILSHLHVTHLTCSFPPYPSDTFSKRGALHPPTKITDIYVTRGRSTVALLKRAFGLLFRDKHAFVEFHAIGAAVSVAVECAVRFSTQYAGSVSLSIMTSTQILVDDYEPLEQDLPAVSLLRRNSSIHIKVTRVSDSVDALKFVMEEKEKEKEQSGKGRKGGKQSRGKKKKKPNTPR